jgi:ribonuclease P protein component
MMANCQQNRGGDEASISQASFKRRFRLTGATDFERVFQENQRSVDGLFTVLYRRNGLGYPRLGMAIAKKQVRSAVARNRLKRLIRESFRVAKIQLSDLDIVIMARRQAGTSANALVTASLCKHWQTLTEPKDTGNNGLR